MADKDLKEYRKDIDSIDNQIMQLLDKRLDVVKKIGDYKKINNLPVNYPGRENEILDKIFSISSNITNRSSISNIYKEIFNESKNLEK